MALITIYIYQHSDGGYDNKEQNTEKGEKTGREIWVLIHEMSSQEANIRLMDLKRHRNRTCIYVIMCRKGQFMVIRG